MHCKLTVIVKASFSLRVQRNAWRHFHFILKYWDINHFTRISKKNFCYFINQKIPFCFLYYYFELEKYLKTISYALCFLQRNGLWFGMLHLTNRKLIECLCCDRNMNDVISTGKMPSEYASCFVVSFRKMASWMFLLQYRHRKAILYLFYKITKVFLEFTWRHPCLCTLIQYENDVSVSLYSEGKWSSSNQSVRATHVIL